MRRPSVDRDARRSRRLTSMMWPAGLLLLLLGACAPVSASHCFIERDSRGVTRGHADITNQTGKPMTYVGVLISTSGGSVEYEYDETFAPGQTLVGRVGREYVPRSRQRGSVVQCWARAVRYADGTTWSVSDM